MPPRTSSFGFRALVVGLLASGVVAAQPEPPPERAVETPSNARLLGALPAAASSYLVADLTRLLADGSAFVVLDPTSRQFSMPGDFFHPVTGAVHRHAGRAGVVALALAASEFTGPPGLGLGGCNIRMIVHVRDPIAAPTVWVDLGGDAIEFETQRLNGVHVFVSEAAPMEAEAFNDLTPPYAGERRCVALADDRTVMLAESPEDVAEMVLAWRGGRDLVPDRFGAAFDPNLLDSPLVMLRDGLPASRAVGLDDAPSDGVFMAVATDVEKPSWLVRYAGTDAADNLERLGCVKHWAAATVEDGVEIRRWSIPQAGYDDREFDILLVPMSLFGILIFI